MCKVRILEVFFLLLGSRSGSRLIVDVSRSYSDIPHSVRLLCRVTDSSHRPVPDDTQHSRKTDTMPLAGFELSSGQSQTHAFDRAATGIGFEGIQFI